MGRFRKTARFFISIGGYDGISPIAKESTQERLLRQQNELVARQNRMMQGPAVPQLENHPVPKLNYYPVAVPGSALLHLIYGDTPDVPTLCGKSGAEDIPEALSIDDVTCAVCRATAGDGDRPPKSPFILTGRCPKCFRPVVWYTDKNKTPVHVATGKFECPSDAGNQDGGGVAAELERLAALHESGALDDDEYRAAKARIIHGRSAP
jgi:hypothetical protein